MSDKQPGPDLARWNYEQKRSMAERSHDQELDFMHRANEAAINAGNNALRALIIINGGAAIAMLAFIGHLVSADKDRFTARLSEMTSPLVWFAVGVALATLGIGFAYVTNYCIGACSAAKERQYDHPYVRETQSSKRWMRGVTVFQILAVLAAFLSLVFFVCGMWEIRNVISNLE